MWFWLRNLAAVQVKEEMGEGGNDEPRPGPTLWVEMEISNGFWNAMEGVFVR